MEYDDKPVAKFLRLLNGDDVIAETVETEDDAGILYTVYHPLKVVYMPSESAGYLSVAFMPWVFPRICDDQEFTIHAEDVLMVVDVSTKMNDYYWDSVGTMTTPETHPKAATEPEYVPEDDYIEEAELEDVLSELGIKRTFH